MFNVEGIVQGIFTPPPSNIKRDILTPYFTLYDGKDCMRICLDKRVEPKELVVGERYLLEDVPLRNLSGEKVLAVLETTCIKRTGLANMAHFAPYRDTFETGKMIIEPEIKKWDGVKKPEPRDFATEVKNHAANSTASKLARSIPPHRPRPPL